LEKIKRGMSWKLYVGGTFLGERGKRKTECLKKQREERLGREERGERKGLSCSKILAHVDSLGSDGTELGRKVCPANQEQRGGEERQPREGKRKAEKEIAL